MNIEAIVFLIIIGIIVILTVTEKNDRVDTKGVIDFKNSHDINGDISKLKAKIKDDAKSARDTKRLLITLIVIIAVILVGFIVVAIDLILNRQPNNLLEKDNDTIVEERDDNKDKEEQKDNEKDKDIKLDDLGEVSNYIKDAESAGNCDAEVIKKDIAYRQDAIKDGSIEIYLVKENKTLKLENTETIDKLLSDYFKSSSYEKLFVINGDGILTKYIYIAKD